MSRLLLHDIARQDHIGLSLAQKKTREVGEITCASGACKKEIAASSPALTEVGYRFPSVRQVVSGNDECLALRAEQAADGERSADAPLVEQLKQFMTARGHGRESA